MMEKRAREVPPDLREMLDLQEPKVSKEILAKLVALASLVRWVLPESLGLRERKETMVQLASLEFQGIQVLKAFQATQVNRVMLDLLVKLELTENRD